MLIPAATISEGDSGFLSRQRLRFDWGFVREHQRDVSTLLFLAAGIYGVASVALYPPQFGPPVEMVIVAKNLVDHGSFANPFLVLPTGPTAAIPPLYPLILAMFMKVARSPGVVYLMAVIGCILANAVTAVLLPRLSLVFYDDVIPGILASLLWIFTMPIIPSYDVSYTILGLVVFCLITSASAASRTHGLGIHLIGAVLAGLIYLLNPATLLIVVPWTVFLLLQPQGELRERVLKCGLIVGILFLFIASWGFRNYLQIGGFATRTTLGMTLYASDNDCAEVDMFRNQLYGCYNSHHPNTNLTEAQLLHNIGEIAYDHKRTRDVEAWVQRNPHRFAVLTLKRVVAFWFPPSLPSYEEIVKKVGPETVAPVRAWVTQRNRIVYAIRIITILSVVGLILAFRQHRFMTLYMLIVLLIYPLLYYIVEADVRFRFPILWLSLLPAGYCIEYISRLGNTEANGYLASSKQHS